MHDSAHAVGDDEHRLILNESGQRRLHRCLVFHIQRGGCLIQQNPGASFKMARAMGECAAVRRRRVVIRFPPDQCMIAVRKSRDESGRTAPPSLQLRTSASVAPRLPMRIFFHHGIGKEYHILKYDGILSTSVSASTGKRPRRPAAPALGWIPKSSPPAWRLWTPPPDGRPTPSPAPAFAVKETSLSTSLVFSLVGKGHMFKADVITVGTVHAFVVIRFHSRSPIMRSMHCLAGEYRSLLANMGR